MKTKPQPHISDNCLKGVQKLTHNLRLSAAQNIYIAYSGGMDSHVLLHLCASINDIKAKITAVYVNHGLQAEAESWGKHCGQVCHILGVNFLSLTVHAGAKSGESPEEAARNARYAALKPLLEKDDALLFAHHADDQLETVLLQLFRGSGLKGLAGMPSSTPFGQGMLLRPLLNVSKADIIQYANDHALQWIEDPSNLQAHFDRNFLRHDILPLIKQRWPSVDKTVARSAKLCADAEGIISSLADELLTSAIYDDKTLNINALQNQSEPYESLIIRQWFHQLGLRMPSQQITQQILGQVVAARADADPILATQGRQIRRYQQRLYCIKRPPLITRADFKLPPDQMSFAVAENIQYEVVPSNDGIPAEMWGRSTKTIHFRSGGESICLPGRSGTRSLKKLLQEAHIPPWERELIPLIYLDGDLAAVGELWIASAFYSMENGDCLRVVRRGMP
jgi:tRNA(Ile)-lysidine synthase